MRPLLKYRGGKLKEIPALIHHIPLDYARYFEPFLGGGAVYFHLEPEISAVSDANEKLMGFYTQLRDQYPDMRAQLDALQQEYERNQAEYENLKQRYPNDRVPNANEALYYRLRELYNHPTGEYLEGVLYFFINKTAYSGMIRYNRGGEYNVPFGRYRHFNTRTVTREHSGLLRKADVLCADYGVIFDRAAPRDFMFLDPPYDCIFNDYGNTGRATRAANGFGEAEHRRLANDFRNLDCRALMVMGRTPLTEALYGGFICGEYGKRYAVNIRNRFQSEATHIVVRNY